jgi:NADH dehydrogenase [ubiquinone] 1 alpha subcomplex assembly factor 7
MKQQQQSSQPGGENEPIAATADMNKNKGNRRVERTPTPVSSSSRTIPSSGSVSSSFDYTTTPSPTRLDLPNLDSRLYLENHPKPTWQSPSLKYGETALGDFSKYNKDTAPTFDLPDEKGIMEHDISSQLFDLEDLYDPNIHLPYAPTSWKGYEPATPLSDYLMQRIGVFGKPLTTAEYMRQCLTHPNFGYYTNPPTLLEKQLQRQAALNGDDNDDEWDNVPDQEHTDTKTTTPSTLIGQRGDFVTAPEVSSVFGNCVCIWLMTQWQVLQNPPSIQLVELGPGRGTLMVDILSLATSSKLRDFGSVISEIHLVEASVQLRSEQRAALVEHVGHVIDFDFGEDGKPPSTTLSNDKKKDTDKISIRVIWHDHFASFQHQKNKDLPVFLVAQEFLDALPVHAFEQTSEGWRERLVDVVDREHNPPAQQGQPLVPRLRQVVAPDTTPAVDLLLKDYLSSGNNSDKDIPVGTVVEICPEAMFLVQDIARVLEESNGVALLIDYGQEGTKDSLRAFSNHEQVPLTSQPGQVDVTADVDFYVLKHTVNRQQGQSATSIKNDKLPILAFGPVTQGEFLMRMGISDIVISKIEQDDTTFETAQALSKALKFLVLPEHMGERFKVLALGRKREGIFAPPGMEN